MTRGFQRRRWARRGTACAEFILAILSVLIASLLRAIWNLTTWMWTLVTSVTRRRRLKEGDHQSRERARETECQGTGLTVASVPKVTFNSVAGLDEAKQEIMVRTLLPLRHPARAAAYNVSTGGGLLLWGPPGCGKTLLARAVAGELHCPFFHVRPSDLMDQWVGQSEKNVAALFQQARNCSQSVVFIDEIDALCPSRRRNHSTIMQRVISEVLSQMDGLDTRCSRRSADGFLLIVGATNWIEALDEAVLRPGRFDVRVFVGLPDAIARRQIIQQGLADRPVSGLLGVEELVERTAGFSGADVANLVETASRNAFLASLNPAVEDQPISPADFERAFARVQSSISSQDLQRYHAAREHWNGS